MSASAIDITPPKLSQSSGKTPAGALEAARAAAAPPPAAAAPAKPDAMADPFAELDGLDEVITGQAAQPKPEIVKQALPEGRKPEPPAKPEPKPAENPAEKVSGTPKKPAKAVDNLRAAYEETKLRAQSLEAELEAMRKAPPPEDPQRKVLAEEKKAIAEALEAKEKRLAELEEEIRYTNYTKSSEFQEKYEKPYNEAWSRAVSELSELTVEDAEGNSRQATPQDLVAICNMPLGEARKMATQLFGDAAEDVMSHRRAIRTLYQAQNQALESARKMTAERDKQVQEARSKLHEDLGRRWAELNREAATQRPEWFAPDEDSVGNSLLEKGFALADRAFSGEQLPPDQMVRLHSAVRNKAAAFDRMVYRNRRLQERIKTLEAEVAGYKASEPGSGDGRGSAPAEAKGGDNWESEIDALDKQ